MIILAMLFGFALALLTAGLVYQYVGGCRDEKRIAAPGRLVDTESGLRLHLFESGAEFQGQGPPTVVLEAGLCATSLNWRQLQNSIAAFAHVVSYDRAGLGWSGPLHTAPTPLNIARELRTLLSQAGISPPFVLVGHSYGSFAVHRFAHLHAAEVAGVVLVDPLQPKAWAPLTPNKKRQLEGGLKIARVVQGLARFGVLRLAIALFGHRISRTSTVPRGGKKGHVSRLLARLMEQVSKMPPELWPAIAAHWSKPRFYRTARAYLRALPEATHEMAAFPPLSGVPVIAITGLRNEFVTDATVNSLATGCRHVRAQQSGHWVHLDEPELVLEAIRNLVEAATAQRSSRSAG